MKISFSHQSLLHWI